MTNIDSKRYPEPGGNEHHPLMIFVTERIEDYAVLSLALAILILILALY